MPSLPSQPQPCVRPWTFPRSKVLLDENASTVEVRITDVSKENYQSALYTVPSEAAAALRKLSPNNVRVRIISVFSDRTIAPLNLTPSLMELLFSQYSIPSGFADVVASFGQEPNIAEGRCNNSFARLNEAGNGDLAYEIRYVEQNMRGGKNPWSLRHTGVYHHFEAANKTDLVVVLHPVRRPPYGATLAALQRDLAMRQLICEDPFLLHELLFDCYFDNWRWYMRNLGERFEKENGQAMAAKPEKKEPNETFRKVQELRNTNDIVLFAHACCAGNRDLLETLLELRIGFSCDTATLQAHLSKSNGYIESANVLHGRIQNLIDLVGYTLMLHNQLESAKVEKELRDLTEHLKNLTQGTVDDSATVKIITFLSAVYLPGSFVATLLGMNLFDFEDGTKKLQISPDFWIFIAAWLPLTLITGGCYMFVKSRSKRGQRSALC